MSALWDPTFGRTDVSLVTGDAAWLQALCGVEAALATACAASGLIATETASTIDSTCKLAGAGHLPGLDLETLGAAAVAEGNPVPALVRALRAAVEAEAGPAAGASVHLGATSQDIVDTAMMLITRDALETLTPVLWVAADACAELASHHRDTAMAARTLLQQAVPTTFGAIAAGWGAGLDRAAAGLGAARTGLAVQLGGAAGTLAGWHPHGPAVRAVLARELGLADPGNVWHTERTRISELAAALATACGVIAKTATDIVLLAMNEVGEVRETAGGGSSAMAHKANPIAAVTARAGAAQAPGLLATLVAAMPAELQRGAGPWHAEWPALTALLRATGGAARRLADSLTGLTVDAEAMSRNLAQLQAGTGTQDSSPDTGHAGDLVDTFLTGRTR